MKNIFIILIFLLPVTLFSDDSNEKIKSSKGFSMFAAYPLSILHDDDETSYPAGIGFGIDFDLGGDIPVINLTGIEFSGSYTYLSHKEKMHYFSTGIAFYLRSAFYSPLNFGLRSGFGGGWVITDKKNEESGNNERTNGPYLFISPFIEIRLFSRMYLQGGIEWRDQKLVLSEGSSTKHFDIYFLRTGVRF